MRPNRGRKRVVPQPGGESFEIGEAGPPVRFHPLSEKATRVEPVPLDEIQIGEAGPPRKPPDPDRPLIPTAEEIARLPRLARAAFAARCARRVLPACRYFRPDDPEESTQVCSWVVTEGERAGAGEPVADSGPGHQADEWAALISAHLATKYDSATFAVGLALDVLDAALSAAKSADPAQVARAAQNAVGLLTFRTTVRTARLVLWVRRDFDRLARLAAEQNWTDETPVPPTVFGPLWPKALTPEWARG